MLSRLKARILFVGLIMAFAVFVCFSLSACSSVNVDLDGSGTKDNPYQINSKEDLYTFADIGYNKVFAKKYFELNCDIDLVGEDWLPLNLKIGNFNGNDFEISNCNIVANNDMAGFFAYAETAIDGKIENISFKNLSFKFVENKLYNAIGGVAANTNLKIEKVNVDVNIDTDNLFVQNFGGIVGVANSDITDCYVTGNVKMILPESQNHKTETVWANIGGVVGSLRANVINTTADVCIDAAMDDTKRSQDFCYHSGGIAGAVNADSAVKIENCQNIKDLKLVGALGGILGTSNSGVDIISCKNSGNLFSQGTKGVLDIGGIASRVYFDGNITNCINSGNITALSIDPPDNGSFLSCFIGGIKGAGLINVANSKNEGDIYVSGSATHYVGGLAGGHDGTLRNSYNTGNITASSAKNTVMAGGLVGVLQTSTASPKLEKCFTLGYAEVKAGTGGAMFSYEMVGGIWGYNMREKNAIKNNYYLSDVYTQVQPTEGYIIPTCAYGEDVPGEGENIEGPDIFNNKALTYKELCDKSKLNGFIEFVNLENLKVNSDSVWVFGGDIPKLYYEA